MSFHPPPSGISISFDDKEHFKDTDHVHRASLPRSDVATVPMAGEAERKQPSATADCNEEGILQKEGTLNNMQEVQNRQKKRDEFIKNLMLMKKENEKDISGQKSGAYIILFDLIISIIFNYFLPCLTGTVVDIMRLPAPVFIFIALFKFSLAFIIGIFMRKHLMRPIVFTALLLMMINAIWAMTPIEQFGILTVKSIVVIVHFIVMRNKRFIDPSTSRHEEKTIVIDFAKEHNGNSGFDFKHSEDGFVITEVHRNSYANMKGVKKGDIIMEINGVRIDGFSEAFAMMMIDSIRGRIKMEVKRKVSV